MAELISEEQRARIAAQLAEQSGWVCPTCWPTLGVRAVSGEPWRLIVDHTPGCQAYAERLLGRELDPMSPRELEALARELELDVPPSREELARWAAEDAEEDPPGQEG